MYLCAPEEIRVAVYARSRRAHHRHPVDPDSAETMAKNRPGSILYALGMTQHTTGVQGIRGFTILQLLLGNIGKPGSGVNALRGEPNVQGACDMGLLNNYLPGYLNYPVHTEPTLEAWTNNNGTAKR